MAWYPLYDVSNLIAVLNDDVSKNLYELHLKFKDIYERDIGKVFHVFCL